MQNNFLKITFFSSLLFLCVSSILFLYFLKVTNKNYQEFQVKESEWKIETQRRDEIKSLERSFKTINKEIVQLDTHFAKSSDIVPFLDTIENLAKKAEIVAEITSVDVPKDEISLVVGMMASGSFTGSYKFLTLLENSPYALEFLAMEMHKESTSDNSKSAKWVTTFKIKLLSFVK